MPRLKTPRRGVAGGVVRNSKTSPDIAELVHLFGLERATGLCMTLGGLNHYIPRNRPSQIVHFLNAEELDMLREGYAGESVLIPKAQPLCMNKLYFVDGMAVPDIARQLKITIAAVRGNIRAGIHPLVADHLRRADER